MTYLQLVRAAMREAGVGDGTNPTSLTSLSGLDLQMKAWVALAAKEISKLREGTWKWQRKTGSLAINAPNREYTPASAGITDLVRWETSRFTIYKDSLGQSYEHALNYREFYYELEPLYELGDALTDQNEPVRFTVTPDNKLRFNPVPDEAYTVRFPYWSEDPALSADGDSPAMPSRHHEIIAWRAVMYYCDENEAPDRRRTAELNYKQMLLDLEKDQLPPLAMRKDTLA